MEEQVVRLVCLTAEQAEVVGYLMLVGPALLPQQVQEEVVVVRTSLLAELRQIPLTTVGVGAVV